MIAVASIRPLDESTEYDKNQLAAKSSWEHVFDGIVYFNHEDSRLASDKTAFIPWEPYPPIQMMAEFCANQEDWCCIINADIVVSPKLKSVETVLKHKQAKAATSWRYEFDPVRGLSTGDIVDQGIDWFAATPSVWRQVTAEVPEQFRIGHCLFDTWLQGFFNTTCDGAFYDITPSRCIFHPKHGGRRAVHPIDSQMRSKYFAQLGMPPKKVRV